MKPNDRFSFLKNNRVSQDPTTLVQCYLPIIGQDALSLYLYTLAFWDGGQKNTCLQLSSSSQFGWNRLLKAFKSYQPSIWLPSIKRVTAMNLLFIQRFLARISASYGFIRTLLEQKKLVSQQFLICAKSRQAESL
mgnify:CR=1 FL=1